MEDVFVLIIFHLSDDTQGFENIGDVVEAAGLRIVKLGMLTLDLKRVDPSSFSSKMLSAASSSDIIGPFLRKTSIKIRVNTPNDLCRFVLIEIKF